MGRRINRKKKKKHTTKPRYAKTFMSWDKMFTGDRDSIRRSYVAPDIFSLNTICNCSIRYKKWK